MMVVAAAGRDCEAAVGTVAVNTVVAVAAAVIPVVAAVAASALGGWAASRLLGERPVTGGIHQVKL